VNTQASFALRSRNPDVLTCIANLSNDEVFTPPELANQMLDALEATWADNNRGENIWKNKNVRFLDPCTKSGVFLREITSRLSKGLEAQIPDLQERIDHILTNQVFGIAITTLTSLLARRSVYCSKSADGKHSIARSLDGDDGNIWYERDVHTWVASKCKFCGASEAILNRDISQESHAYAFIHTDDIKHKISQIFGGDMQFDVIIGNPPYQLSTGGGTATQQATPIYQEFVRQAKTLEPKLLVMITPSRWFSGGMAALESFRTEMLNDTRIKQIVDFPDSRDAFSGVDISGGVSYFLWDCSHNGDCKVVTVVGKNRETSIRKLNAYGVFVRSNRAISIIEKVLSSDGFESLSDFVSAVSPFGLPTSFRGSESSTNLNNPIVVRSTAGRQWAERNVIQKNLDWVDKWKVLLSATASEHAGQADKAGARRVFSRIEVMEPGSAVTHSYLILGPLSNQKECINISSYLKTKFVRFLVAQIVSTQHISKSNFAFVPKLDFGKLWTDDDLFKSYKFNDSEIDFIDTSIRAIEIS
jgi:hypothetical protein